MNKIVNKRCATLIYKALLSGHLGRSRRSPLKRGFTVLVSSSSSFIVTAGLSSWQPFSYPNDPYKEDVWPQGLGMLTQVSLICYNIHLKYFDDTLTQCMDSSPGEFSTGIYRYYITNII